MMVVMFIAFGMPMTVSMAVPVVRSMTCTAQQPGTGNIHSQANDGNRNGFAEMDGYRGQETGNGFVAYQ